jgi:alkylation response protein AidB-like acyl-CoA dehydrogenase
MAGVRTSAVRDGDTWVLNGSKIWTTGAWWSDWGLCLARTNWDVPKHRGLTVFILPIRQEGIEMHRIEMLNGNREFCQEFLTDVLVPDSDRVGEVDDGWTVGTRWLLHERLLYSSPLVTVPEGSLRGPAGSSAVHAIARDVGRLDDPVAQELVGEVHMLELVGKQLSERLRDGMVSRTMSDQAAAIGKLFGGMSSVRTSTVAMELAGAAGAAWSEEDGAAADRGTAFLMRQAGCIGGGTTEMARNAIAERILGMPRDAPVDRDIAFREVPTGNTGARRPG